MSDNRKPVDPHGHTPPPGTPTAATPATTVANQSAAEPGQSNESVSRHADLEQKASFWRRWWPSQRGKSSQHYSHYEFLPAVLEVQESPPSPLGRAILWTIVSLFALAVVWSIIGKVDIVAVAQGKIIPSGRVKLIQPLESGVVTQINVQEGQPVKQGETLVELDPTSTAADQRRLEQELRTARLNLARLRALLALTRVTDTTPTASAAELPDPLAPPPAPTAVDRAARFADVPGATQIEIATQQQLLDEELATQQARVAALDKSLDRQRAETRTTQTLVAKYQATLPLITTRVKALKKLLDQNLAAESDYLTLKQEQVEQQHDLAAQQSRLQQLEAAATEIIEQRKVTIGEFNRNTRERLAEEERKQLAYTEELTKARQRSGLQQLRSPIDGIVQQLAIYTVGGVVTPAQTLMVIVPQDSTLQIEAWVLNRDIGFVNQGDPAVVKIEAFPFTKFGTIDGEITTLSRDAVADEQLGLVYAAQTSMQSSTIMVDGKAVALSPGMAATVEIKTGTRRLIEYFLSPLLKFKDESIRER